MVLTYLEDGGIPSEPMNGEWRENTREGREVGKIMERVGIDDFSKE